MDHLRPESSGLRLTNHLLHLLHFVTEAKEGFGGQRARLRCHLGSSSFGSQESYGGHGEIAQMVRASRSQIGKVGGSVK